MSFYESKLRSEDIIFNILTLERMGNWVVGKDYLRLQRTELPNIGQFLVKRRKKATQYLYVRCLKYTENVNGK